MAVSPRLTGLAENPYKSCCHITLRRISLVHDLTSGFKVVAQSLALSAILEKFRREQLCNGTYYSTAHGRQTSCVSCSYINLHSQKKVCFRCVNRNKNNDADQPGS